MSRQPSEIPKEDLPPLAAALVDKPVWVRLAVLLPVICLGLGVVLGIPGYFTWKALSSVPAKATVETCEPASKKSTCHGSWVTEDGERGSGEIDGASESDEGSTIDVWVAGGSATTSPPWSMWFIPGLFGLAFVIAGVLIVKALRDARRYPGGRPQVARDWEPPREFPPRHVPALYAAPEVHVTWEPRSFGGDLNYEFSAPTAGVLARASEPDLSMARRIWRFLDQSPGDQRHRLVCLDPSGNLLFTVDKPKNRFALFNPGSAIVLGPTGRNVGAVTQLSRNPFKRRFACHDESGRLMARLAHLKWTSESYRVTDRHGTEVARLVHGVHQRPVRANGVYRYVLQLRQPPQESLHTMLLASVIAIQLLIGEF